MVQRDVARGVSWRVNDAEAVDYPEEVPDESAEDATAVEKSADDETAKDSTVTAETGRDDSAK